MQLLKFICLKLKFCFFSKSFHSCVSRFPFNFPLYNLYLCSLLSTRFTNLITNTDLCSYKCIYLKYKMKDACTEKLPLREVLLEEVSEDVGATLKLLASLRCGGGVGVVVEATGASAEVLNI